MIRPDILLVDDEPGIRNVLKITLESAGHAVKLACDGEEGFNVFSKEQPQIVITDIKMPGVDGIHLLKKIKQIRPDTEVIMITGHGDMALAVKSLKYEAADFITKPIDSGDLDAAIQKAVERITITRNVQEYMDDLETLVKEKDRLIDESENLVTIGLTIAGMSHAIKNIAGGLKGSSFVLEQGIEQENRDLLKQGWEMMKGNINKITQLSLDLLNYAKTTRLDFKPMDPNAPAWEVSSLMQQAALERNIDFQFYPSTTPRQVVMDASAIQSCLHNLVTNAFDACDKSSDSMAGNHHAPRSVSLSVTCNTRGLTYTVKDNGCGVNAAIQPFLFNDFITTKGMNGTGFGLMTTQKIVSRHDGKIRFKPGKDAGSEFTIQIPMTLKSKRKDECRPLH